jgi:phosphate transport system ATP-binding protein
LKNISLSVKEKTISSFIGPSGCGKTTLLRCLNRMHEMTPGARVTGEVLVDGVNIYDKSIDPAIIMQFIGMVFQKPNPFPTMSIFNNVASGLKLSGIRDRKLISEVVEEALRGAVLWDEVKNELGKPGMSLSVGSSSDSIARALVMQPEVILMDEPISSLDPIATSKIEELVRKLREHVTIVIVTNNMQQAARISDFTSFMYLGEMIEYGPTTQIFRNPQKELTERYISGKFG